MPPGRMELPPDIQCLTVSAGTIIMAMATKTAVWTVVLATRSANMIMNGSSFAKRNVPA